jgi:hypothetical protein
MKLPRVIAVAPGGLKLWQTGTARNVQLATGYIEMNGARLGPTDSLIESLLTHCPQRWVPVDGPGRRAVDIVLRGGGRWRLRAGK